MRWVCIGWDETLRLGPNAVPLSVLGYVLGYVLGKIG